MLTGISHFTAKTFFKVFATSLTALWHRNYLHHPLAWSHIPQLSQSSQTWHPRHLAFVPEAKIIQSAMSCCYLNRNPQYKRGSIANSLYLVLWREEYASHSQPVSPFVHLTWDKPPSDIKFIFIHFTQFRASFKRSLKTLWQQPTHQNAEKNITLKTAYI